MTTPMPAPGFAPPTAAGQPLPPEPQPVPPMFQPQPPVPLPAYEQPTQAVQAGPAPMQIPEGGYAQRFVTIRLAEFDQPGIQCSVRLRNPGLMSQGTFETVFDAVEGVELDENGEPKVDAAQAKQAMPALYGQMLKLIAGWTMWDAESDTDVPPLLPSPPQSAEDLKRAPAGALRQLLTAIQELSDPQ